MDAPEINCPRCSQVIAAIDLPNWYEREYEAGHRTWQQWARKAKLIQEVAC